MGSVGQSGDDVPRVSAQQMLTVGVEWHGSTALLDVSGEVDVLSASRLEETVAEVLGHQPATMVVDLSRVAFLASAGLAVLVSSSQRAGERVEFRVVAEGSATGRPLHLTGLDQQFSVFPSREEALNTQL